MCLDLTLRRDRGDSNFPDPIYRRFLTLLSSDLTGQSDSLVVNVFLVSRSRPSWNTIRRSLKGYKNSTSFYILSTQPRPLLFLSKNLVVLPLSFFHYVMSYLVLPRPSWQTMPTPIVPLLHKSSSFVRTPLFRSLVFWLVASFDGTWGRTSLY